MAAVQLAQRAARRGRRPPARASASSAARRCASDIVVARVRASAAHGVFGRRSPPRMMRLARLGATSSLGDLAASAAADARRRARPGRRVPARLERACSPAPGYVAPHWPAPWGLDADPAEQLAIDEVDARAARARARSIRSGSAGPGPTLLVAGTEAQQQAVAARASSTAPSSGASCSASRTRAATSRRCRRAPCATATSTS